MITTKQFVGSLNKANLSANQWRTLRAIYTQPGHKCSPTELTELLGYSDVIAANGAFGVAARTIGEYLGQEPDEGADWFSIIAYWNTDSKEWVLHDNFVTALETVGVGKRTTTTERSGMKTALFINGVFDRVMEDILKSQESGASKTNYLQPYKGSVIQMLKGNPPTPDDPITAYFSTTKNLNNIAYVAQIVGWDDKRTLPAGKRNQVLEHLNKHQSGEVSLLNGADDIGKKAVNLLTLRSVQQCKTLVSTSILKKRSDGLALKPRTRAGGWSEVFDLGDVLLLPTEPQEVVESVLKDAIKKAEQSTESERQKRLASASPVPERIQLLSTGFRRNADVIVEVLKRAAGICEKCKNPAPFKRKSDGSPFLEVHHWKPLSDAGEDTVENAGAICPNCHREVHFG